MSFKRKKSKKKNLSKPKLKKIKRMNTGEFLDRELSLLEFNKRVLEQAMDEKIPLLERVKFLSIFHSNLDEFYMKRVDLSKRVRVQSHVQQDGVEKVITYEQHKLIRKAVLNLIKSASECYENEILPDLRKNGILLLSWKDLKKEEVDEVNKIFDEKIFPVLTPLGVDPVHPFPHISNLSTSLAISLKSSKKAELSFARIKIPPIFPQWITLSKSKDEPVRWISLIEVISHNLHKLFSNMEIVSCLPFRITRNIELDPDEEDHSNIIEIMEQLLKERRFGEVVKLEVPVNADPWLLRFLKAELDLIDDDIYMFNSLIDFTSLRPLTDLNLPFLKYEPWSPVVPTRIAEEQLNLFHCISGEDLLVHHPYESFTASTEAFIRTATEDPNVLAIKITLYRTNEDSRLIRSLINAAEAGKQVVCLIEVKARMDEERNMTWARTLEESGVHIVYGMVGLKTHSKVALVVRQERGQIKCYAHLGTGNYNAQTAKLYTDLGLLTSNRDITNEVVEFFHHLTGYSEKKDYKKLLVAPINMKDKFLDLIENEIKNANKDLPSGILVKCNGLEDGDICKALYRASQAGVKIQMIVRGMCILKPGVEGLSENIRVISILDRFLEHSRVYYFYNGSQNLEEAKIYIGSADWMYRNLERRVEVCVPISDLSSKKRIKEVFHALLNDRVQSWKMNSDGSYTRNKPLSGDSNLSAQESLMLNAVEYVP